MDWVKSLQGHSELLKKYGYLAVVLLAGLLFMVLPSSQQEKPQPAEAIQEQPPQDLQTQLETILSRVEGAGKVKVLLTQSMSERTIYQTDDTLDTSQQSESIRKEVVILSDATRGQKGLVQQTIAPVYLGAVVLCQGADKPAVKLAVMEAVSNATGLGTHNISVLKMK